MWRGTSLRKISLLLLGPMITETLASMFPAWMVLVADKSQGYAPWQHMLIPSMGSMGYAISSWIAGRWVTPRWATRLMVVTILLMTGAGLAAATIKVYVAFVLLSFTMGFSIGHYYTPFQIN